MKNSLGRVAGLVTAAMLVLALSACGGSSGGSASSGSAAGASNVGSSGSVKLAGVLANMSDPFWATIACGATAEAKKRGASLKLFTSNNTADAETANNFQTALLTKPQGILVNPFNANQFVAQYQSLAKDGVPVVTASGTTPPAEHQVVFSSTDTAKFAADLASSIPSGSGTMVYISGAPGIPPLESRTFPFTEAIQKQSGLKRLKDVYTGFDINKATTQSSALLLSHPDLKVIIAADGPDAAGAAAAVKQAGKTGKVAVFGFDAIPPEVAALKDGTISALIAQNPGGIGRAQVDSLVDYLESNPSGPVPAIAPKLIDNKVLTKDTVDDPANADYVYKASC
jgi:ribose transport system substrate-binding protein